MTMTIPLNPSSRLSREETAQALTREGFPLTSKALATMASRGGGPAYRVFGRRTLYLWGDALQWAEARLSTPRKSTSEADAR